MSYAMLWTLALVVGFLYVRGEGKPKRFYVILTMLANVVYLAWRAAYTLPVEYGAVSIVLGVLLLLAELMGFLQSALFRVMFARPEKQVIHTLDEWETPPTVDVLIATYNESIPILRKTLTACLNMDYPVDRR